MKEEHDIRHKLFFEASGDGMLLVATDGNILDANRAACHVLKRAREEVISAGLSGVFDPSDPRLENAWEEHRRTERFEGELHMLRQDSKSFPAEVSMAALQEERIGIVFRDITGRKGTEEASLGGKEFYRTLVGNALDMVAVTEPDATVRYVSPSVEWLLGYKPEEWVGTRAPEYIHPEDLEEARRLYVETLMNAGVNPTPMEVRYRRADGSYRYHEVVINNLLHDPNVRGLLFNGRDTTERRRLEERLQFLSLLVENSLDVIAVQEPDTTARYLSPSIERMLGYRPEELIGKKIADLIHPDDLERMQREAAEVFDKSGPFGFAECRYRHKDGSYRYLQATVNNRLDDPSIRGIISTVRDVTERRGLEEKLRFLSLLVENAEDVIGVTEADGTIRYMSPSVERILGYRPEEMVGTNSFDYLHPDELEWAKSTMADAVSTPGPSQRIEFRYRHKDGSWRYLESTGHNGLEDPGVNGILFVSRDITERKRAEEALRQTEEKYRALVEQVPVVTYIDETDDLASSIYVSPQVEGLLGYSLEEWDEDRLLWSKRLHPEDESRVHAECYRCRDSGETFKMEYRLIAKDGSVVWVRDDATVVHDEEGRPRYWRGVKLDITEQKRAEEELRESEERFRLMFENASDIITILETDGTIRYASPSLERVLGYRPEEWVGTNAFDHVHSDDLEQVVNAFTEHMTGEGISPPIEFRTRSKDGEWRYFEAIGNNLNRSSAGSTVVISRDIAERKRAQERERFLSLLVENALDMMVVAEADGTLRYINPAGERVLGIRSEEVVGTAGFDRIHPEDIDKVHSSFAELMSNPEAPLRVGDLRHRHTDGSWRYLEGFAHNLLDHPNVRGILFTTRDVTERKRAGDEIRRLNETLEKRVVERTAQLEDTIARLESNERMLRESEEKFRTTFDQAAVGIAHVAPDGQWLRVNRKLCEIVGYTHEELLKKTFQDITHSDDLENDLDHLRRMLAGEIDTYSIEKRYVKKDYSKVWVSLTVSLVREPSGDPGYFISVVEDITERKQAEQVLRSLTSREIEVLRLLARGYTNPKIAQSMALSVSTVKNHIQQIIHKLGVSDRTQAAVRAVELGLIEPE